MRVKISTLSMLIVVTDKKHGQQFQPREAKYGRGWDCNIGYILLGAPDAALKPPCLVILLPQQTALLPLLQGVRTQKCPPSSCDQNATTQFEIAPFLNLLRFYALSNYVNANNKSVSKLSNLAFAYVPNFITIKWCEARLA
jgi:hypothetical protein